MQICVCDFVSIESFVRELWDDLAMSTKCQQMDGNVD